MTQVGQHGPSGDVELILLEQEILALERPARERRPVWPWLLVSLALVVIAVLCAHGYSAYATIVRIDASSRIPTANPLVLFQDVATNGPRVGTTVDASSRATYTRALEQFVLDGTGVVVGLVLAIAGVFVRANV